MRLEIQTLNTTAAVAYAIANGIHSQAMYSTVYQTSKATETDDKVGERPNTRRNTQRENCKPNTGNFAPKELHEKWKLVRLGLNTKAKLAHVNPYSFRCWDNPTVAPSVQISLLPRRDGVVPVVAMELF